MITVPNHLTEFEEIQKYIIEEAQKQAKQIAEERRVHAYFAKLHEKATEETGEKLGSTDALIQRLLPFASTKLQNGLGLAQGKSKEGRAPRFKATKENIAKAKAVYAETKSYGKVAKAIGTTYPTARDAVNGKYDSKI
ncbi:MAG: hypothetical protein LR015_08610 [Verrucomicrobia bacterium]|nr:hypothetical protein [Verrucomicrobiota bacterium]